MYCPKKKCHVDHCDDVSNGVICGEHAVECLHMRGKTLPNNRPRVLKSAPKAAPNRNIFWPKAVKA